MLLNNRIDLINLIYIYCFFRNFYNEQYKFKVEDTLFMNIEFRICVKQIITQNKKYMYINNNITGQWGQARKSQAFRIYTHT